MLLPQNFHSSLINLTPWSQKREEGGEGRGRGGRKDRGGGKGGQYAVSGQNLQRTTQISSFQSIIFCRKQISRQRTDSNFYVIFTRQENTYSPKNFFYSHFKNIASADTVNDLKKILNPPLQRLFYQRGISTTHKFATRWAGKEQ